MRVARKVIAGASPLGAEPHNYLTEAYAVLTVIGCAIAEDSGSKPTEGILRAAIDGAATLVALGYGMLEQ